jgi:hypothetical protein
MSDPRRCRPVSNDGAAHGLGKAKPTAVQSGNRSATLLGERSRRIQSRSTVCLILPAARRADPRLMGPRRAQAPKRICQQNRSDTDLGPRGDIASHFVGLLFFPSGLKSHEGTKTRRNHQETEKKETKSVFLLLRVSFVSSCLRGSSVIHRRTDFQDAPTPSADFRVQWLYASPVHTHLPADYRST